MSNPILPLYGAYAVSPDYNGLHARAFHQMIARNYLRGMTGGHTSAAPGAKQEDLVREHLAIDWCKERGLYRGMNRFDGRFNWRSWRHWQDEITKVRCFIARCRYHFTPNPYS